MFATGVIPSLVCDGNFYNSVHIVLNAIEVFIIKISNVCRSLHLHNRHTVKEDEEMRFSARLKFVFFEISKLSI